MTDCFHVTLTADQCVPSASLSVRLSTPPASPTSTASPPGSPPGSPSVVVTVHETVCTPGPSSLGQETSPVPAQTNTPGPSRTSTPCSTNLVSGSFEFPHLIIPIDSSSPNTAAGTQFNVEVTATISTIFNFDIPASDAGKTCSLVFHFPQQKDLRTSLFTFSGDGKVDFAELSFPATQSTTFNNTPSVKTDFGVTTISPGNFYVISTFACPAGQAVTFEMKEAGTTDFTFFEDFNPSPYVPLPLYPFII